MKGLTSGQKASRTKGKVEKERPGSRLTKG